MRTYTRKKQNHQMIENVHELCRLCLQQTKGAGTVSLFENQSEYLFPSLTKIIMMLLDLEITNEECLPNTICLECFEKLNKYYAFKKNCAITYQTLKSHSLEARGVLVNKNTTSKDIDNSYNCNEDEKLTLTIDEDQQLQIISSKQVESNINEDSLVIGVSQHNDNKETENPNFLTSLLLEMGILKKQYEECLETELNDQMIELETADGYQLTLQLFECDDEQHNTVVEGSSTVLTYKTKQDKVQDGRPTCDVCGRRFASRGVLRRHTRVHTGERPFACRACPLRFAQREVLRRHEFVHQENRPYACGSCPKSFTQRRALEMHVRTHAPATERAMALHNCPLCPKMFLHQSGLSRHMKHHDGQTNWCAICSRQFRDQSSLVRHQRSAHAVRVGSGTSDVRNKCDVTDVSNTCEATDVQNACEAGDVQNTCTTTTSTSTSSCTGAGEAIGYVMSCAGEKKTEMV